MSAPDLQSLFMIEQDFETEFVRILTQGGATNNIFQSRTKRDMETPWLEVQFLVGRVTRRKQKQAIPGFDLYYDSDFEGSQLELKVCTQRQNNGDQHKVILGRARSLVTFPALCGTPSEAGKWSQQYHAIMDIREQGTIHSFDSDNDLDFSTVTFSLVHNIKDDAWPVTSSDLPFSPSDELAFAPQGDLMFA